jgi:phosphoadenosine phosphosulfate reductase
LAQEEIGMSAAVHVESFRPAPPAEDAEPEDIVGWALDRFEAKRLVLTTSFGMEGCALIDMVARQRRPVRVASIDTGFLFPETHALRDRMAARYPHLRFERKVPGLSPEEQDRRHGPALWERDPDGCCRIRKVEPMRELLADADVWLTAVTRSQSDARADLRAVEWNRKFQVLKVSPLCRWDRQRVWEYVRSRNVPYNELHERGYPTLGCVQCTRPVTGTALGEYSRAGRWVGRDKMECGLHGR